MFIVRAYIKFLLRSSNQHGVHSPFVYGLVTKCFYDRRKYPAYGILKNFRKSLLKDKREIQVTDFGAGSRVFRSDIRRVSEITKNAGISRKRARLLNRLVRYLKIKNALELGTSVGLGTAAMAVGNKVKVTSIEGCPQTAKIAAEKFRKLGLDTIELKVGKFEEILGDRKQKKYRIPESRLSPAGADSEERHYSDSSSTDHEQQVSEDFGLSAHKYDLIYIDGNHQKEATLRYFKQLLPTVHNDSVMIFDDIHWSPEMEEAWEEIREHSAVKVTIDTFQWGLVFFRREQEKEHFVIRA